jgi:hypothetical protein
MGREEGDRLLLLSANPDRLTAVATIFRGEQQLLLDIVEIALGPAKIVGLRDLQEFLAGRLAVVELWPVLVEFVSSLLRCVEAQAGRINGDAVGVADTGRVTSLGEKTCPVLLAS